MSDLTDAQCAVYIDRILECRKAEDTAKEDTKQAYADLKDAGGDKTEAGLLVRALRMEEKDAGKAKAREEMLEEARLRYRRGKASHVRAREGSQSYAEAKGRPVPAFVAITSDGSEYRFDPETGELTDTQEQPEEPAATNPVLMQEPRVEADRDGGAVHEHGREEGSHPRLPSDPAENKTDGPSVIAADNSPSPSSAPRMAADDVPPKPQDASSASIPSSVTPPPPGETDKAGDVPPPSSPAALSDADVPAFLKPEQRKTSADYRPECKHPDNCGSSNPTGYCYQCRRAMEAASETEAA